MLDDSTQYFVLVSASVFPIAPDPSCTAAPTAARSGGSHTTRETCHDVALTDQWRRYGMQVDQALWTAAPPRAYMRVAGERLGTWGR